MTKSEVKAALNDAIMGYNEDMEEYIKFCDEPVKDDYRKIVASTMQCFAEFREVIMKLAD